MYSYSKIQSYFNCPMLFRFRYIDKPDIEKFETVEAFLGGIVHKALEKLYSDRKYEKENTLEDVVGHYENLWQDKFHDAIVIVRKNFTAQNYLDMGRKYVTDYYNKNHPFDESRTLSLEKKIMLKLDAHTITGFIDRLAIGRDSVYEVHDYKTSGSMPQKDYFEKDEQLALYALAVRNSYEGAKDIRLVWHYLAFNRSFASVRNEGELEQLGKNIIRKIGIIENAVKDDCFIPNPTALCSWCEYQKMCPVHKKRFGIEAVPAEAQKDAARLADQYAELKNRQRELEKRSEEIRNDIIMHCRRYNTDRLEGSEFVAKVSETVSKKFPTAGDEKRAELERLLKEHKLWEKVSALDAHALDRALKETLVGAALAEKIRSFSTEETVQRVTLSRKNE